MAYNRPMKVDWNPDKNAENQTKHGLSFEAASELFSSGRDYLEIFDDVHSEDEDRFIAIGLVHWGVVVIVWTERDEDTVWNISARRATPREHAMYQRYLEQRHDR